MAGLTLSAADNLLKTFYLGPIREQLNGSTILLSRLDRDETTQDVYGKNFTVPLHTGRNAQAGSGRASGGTLPSTGRQSYSTAVVPNKYVYTGIEIEGPAIKAMRSNAGAFVRAVESEIKGATRDMKRSINRQLFGDGRDALAFWTGADDVSGTTVDDGRTAGNAFVHLQSGVICDLIDAGDNSTKNGDSIVVTVGATGASSVAITWTGTVSGSADTDYLVLEDTLGYQMMGLQGIIATGNPALLSGGLHGIDGTTNGFWNAQVFANSGTNRTLTLALMQKPISSIVTNSDYSETDIKFLLGSVGVRDAYVGLLVANKRYVNTMKLDGGFTGVEFNGYPLVTDPQAPKNKLFYVTPDTLKIFRTSDFDWMQEDGAVLSRVAGKDSYGATMFHYGDLACTSRNGNGLLDDITEA